MEQLYPYVQDIHNFLRWIVLALALITIVKFFIGWKSKSEFKSIDNRLSLFYVSSLDLQLLIGLILYFFLSPITGSMLRPGNATFQEADVRFFTMEHPVIMLLAIICAHVSRIAMKKAKTDTAKFRLCGIWVIFSLILILAGIPW